MRTPFEIEKAGAKVILSGAYSLLDTSFGLQVKFDGVHHLEITVPGEYFSKVRRAIRLVPPPLPPALKKKVNLSAGMPVFETLAELRTMYDP